MTPTKKTDRLPRISREDATESWLLRPRGAQIWMMFEAFGNTSGVAGRSFVGSLACLHRQSPSWPNLEGEM